METPTKPKKQLSDLTFDQIAKVRGDLTMQIAEAEEVVKTLKAKREKLDTEVMRRFNEDGLTSVKTAFGSLHTVVRTSASCADKDTFLDWIRESDNWDFSLEWYYGEASYISAGYFDKSVVNFVTSAEQQDVVLYPDLAHPALGPLYADAIDNLGITASNGDIRDFIFTKYPNEPGVDAVNQVITGVPGRDGPAYFDVDTRINSDEEAKIDGWELAWQHSLWDTGFGFIANMTLASGSAVFDNSSDDPQFALPGLSDTRNFILYYEGYGFEARAAYNWRDSYFVGGVTKPAYTEEYEQWDASASYQINDGLVVFVEGINLTNETFRTHGRDQLQLYSVGQLGARYSIGFRYTY